MQNKPWKNRIWDRPGKERSVLGRRDGFRFQGKKNPLSGGTGENEKLRGMYET